MSSVAYILRKAQPSSRKGDIVTGRLPKLDYDRFPEVSNAQIVDLGFDYPGPSPLDKVVKRLGLMRSALRMINGPGRNFDQYVTTGEDIGIPLALAMLLSMNKKPLHIIFHGHLMERRQFTVTIKLLRGRRNIHWHPLSDTLRRSLIERFDLSPDRVHPTGYSVDTTFYRLVDTAPSAIVSAGLAHRDYKTMIDAAKDLKVQVRIAAASAWITRATNIDGVPIPQHIDVRSAGDYLGLRALYESAFFVVVPMEKVPHACGYAVIAEAMAAGKAVIATRTGAVCDFLIEGETGFLVEPYDADELRDRMERLLRDPALARRMGENARRLMETKYSLDRFCERLQRAIDLAGPAGMPQRRVVDRPFPD
jgi:glycosyltransferase involved in cell wall biosynthesis